MAALLTAAEIGGTFTEGTYTPTQRPEPCAPAGSRPLDEQVPPQVSVGRNYQNASPAALYEEHISAYADTATAQHALTLGKRGLGCTSGTVYASGGKKVSIAITGPQDVSGALGTPVDAAFAWTLSNSQVKGTLVVVELGPALVALTFQAIASADVMSLPDTTAIVQRAIAKVKNS